jgi:hypothetical protein
MTEDARFEDGGEKPLYLGALDADDLKVVASLVQDAVLPVTEISWQPGKRRLALLINRVRWEDKPAAERRDRTAERVQSVLVVDNVMSVGSQGISQNDKDMILSLLTVEFEAGEDAGGAVVLTFAGDGALRASVEALEVQLRDVTRPYLAAARAFPTHD